jgi:hypothetical protein
MKNQIKILNWIRRVGLFAFIMLGTSTIANALSTSGDMKLTKAEAMELVAEVKEKFNLDDSTSREFVIDDEGNVSPAPIKTIRIYDNDNELLLEAPIHTIEQMRNKELRRLVNASDFLTSYNSIYYYQLNID